MIHHRFGENYRGPGCADPKKTREERERELHQMTGTEDGREVIRILTHEAREVPLGALLWGSLVIRDMIRDILDHEYGKT